MGMGISHYIREIGRGKEGARHLSRAQASELMSQFLNGQVSDLGTAPIPQPLERQEVKLAALTNGFYTP